jgi:outer membrane protein assembly factor BamB
MISCASKLILRDGGSMLKISIDKADTRFVASSLDDSFYISFEDGEIVKIDKKSGEILWKRDISTFVNATFSADEENLYFISINNDFYVLDKESGKIKFIYYGTNEVTILNQIPPVILGNEILVIFHNNQVNLFSKNDWSVVWSRILDSKKLIQKNDVKVIDTEVFVHDMAIN